jgi:hypothetical protein
MVALVPSNPITPVRLCSAAGLIAGTVPTTGTPKTARAWESAMVDAVFLHLFAQCALADA